MEPMPKKLDSFNRFMSQFIPMLVRQQMEQQRSKMWLDKTLKEYGAWFEGQKGLQESAAEREKAMAILKLIIDSLKGLDRPELALPGRLQESGYGEAFPGLAPAARPPQKITYEEATTPYAELMGTIAESFNLAPEFIEAIHGTTMLKGSKYDQKVIEDKLKQIKEEADRKLREKGLKGEAESRAIKKKEVGLREEELKLEKGKAEGKTTKEKKLKDLLKKRERFKLVNIGEADEDMIILTKQINALQKELGQKSYEEYEILASDLKAQGYDTLKKIEKTPGMIDDIKKDGYEIWVLAGYL